MPATSSKKLTIYTATLTPLSYTGIKAAVAEAFAHVENLGAGWQGEVTVDPTLGNAAGRITIEQAFESAVAHGLAAGKPVRLDLNRLTASGGSTITLGNMASHMTPIRSWPSMVRRVAAVPKGAKGADLSGAGSGGDTVYQVLLCDPLTYFSCEPIWGVFRDEPLEEIVGGAISLAAGGDGKPTATPRIGQGGSIEVTVRARGAQSRGAPPLRHRCGRPARILASPDARAARRTYRSHRQETRRRGSERA